MLGDQQKQRLLLVDDDPRNIRIMQICLGDKWVIETAECGVDAVSKAKSFAPDIVLLDIMMPDISGYEVCQKIRAMPELKFTKVILITGKAMPEERIKGYELGADDYMTKPFLPEELYAKVVVYLRLTQLEKELNEMNQSLEARVIERTSQLKEAEAKMVYSAKMVALGEMAGSIAHEINTPLATITLLLGQAQELLSEPKLNIEYLNRAIELIEKTTDRIAKIIQSMRLYSRDSKRDDFQRASLATVLNETIILCNEKVKLLEIEVSVKIEDTDFSLNCRPTELSQVMLNLINNSCDAICNLSEKWIHISLEANHSDLIFKITDSGAGLPSKILEKIFTPFFTTKEVGKGTGLGLSISKKIIESHGGTLILDQQCANTRFIASFPR